jgi:hypothetical protein
MAAGHSVDPARWQEAFEVLMGRIAGRFARVELRRRVRDLILGLLSDLPRKNCWPIAEWAGETSPDGMQHLLGRARWDADRVRDDVRKYVLEHLRDEDAVLSSSPCTTWPTGSAGPPGDVATRPEPRPAITGGKPRIRHEDHDLRLDR